VACPRGGQVHVALREPRAHIPARPDSVRTSHFEVLLAGVPT
jgi:hypothetical protein